jgi:hypothetical protein
MRRNCRGWTGALLGAWTLSFAPWAALAENAAPTPTPSVDARADAQKSAFLALPEADRKAVQDALGWLGLYNGAVDGAWGKRTRDSILAYQGGASATADGLVTASQLAALKTAARKARAAVGFEILDERRSGVRIGAPLKILTKIALVGGDATLSTPDGAAALAMQARVGDQANLATLYGKLNAETSTRKVTYKAIKADDFFVVAGEDGTRKFYARFAKSPADWADGPSLRGFTFAYPKDQAGDLDKVALAIANSFEPFSNAPTSLDTAAARASSAPLTWRDIVKQASEAGGSPATPSAPADAGAKPPPSAPETLATGLIVGPGQVLTALGAAECANATVDGKPAKTLRADAASGLVLLAGDFAPAGAPQTYGTVSADLVVLSFASGAAGKTTLEASAGFLTPGDGPQAVVAALGKGASGAPVFDRKGDVAALVGPLRGEPARVGGVALAGPHATIAFDAIARFVGQPGAPASAQGPDLSAGDIARVKRAAVAPVVCRP